MGVHLYILSILKIAHLICYSAFIIAEPHEICDEENTNVVWKRTPAGDTAAIRCPPTASGQPMLLLACYHLKLDLMLSTTDIEWL